jgi:hypothetical protein
MAEVVERTPLGRLPYRQTLGGRRLHTETAGDIERLLLLRLNQSR